MFVIKTIVLVVTLNLLNRDMTLREKQQNFVHTIKTNTKEHDDVFVRCAQNKRLKCRDLFSLFFIVVNVPAYVSIRLFWRFPGAEIPRVCLLFIF